MLKAERLVRHKLKSRSDGAQKGTGVFAAVEAAEIREKSISDREAPELG